MTFVIHWALQNKTKDETYLRCEHLLKVLDSHGLSCLKGYYRHSVNPSEHPPSTRWCPVACVQGSLKVWSQWKYNSGVEVACLYPSGTVQTIGLMVAWEWGLKSYWDIVLKVSCWWCVVCRGSKVVKMLWFERRRVFRKVCSAFRVVNCWEFFQCFSAVSTFEMEFNRQLKRKVRLAAFSKFLTAALSSWKRKCHLLRYSALKEKTKSNWSHITGYKLNQIVQKKKLARVEALSTIYIVFGTPLVWSVCREMCQR